MANAHKKTGGMSPWRTRPLRVLVDMDGVLCDFEGYFLEQFRKIYPDEPFIPLSERNMFYVDNQYAIIREELKDKCKGIIESEGFFRDLPPIEGSIEAVKELSGMDDVDVFLCTSPLSRSPDSVKEKFQWVLNHLGRAWIGKTVISRDKTIVSGDILIDDRPKIHGLEKNPSWDHILFTCCHNKHIDIKKNNVSCSQRLDGWTDGSWRQLIEQYKKKIA